MLKRFTPLVILCAGVAITSPLKAAETDCLVRDPSTIVKRGDTYWIYGTGKGVAQFSSHDRLHWTYQGPVFSTAPLWVADTVSGNRNNIAWAPDIRYFDGLYHLYYSYSTIGSKTSGIGVAVNATLDPKGWADKGVVIASGSATDFNTIDPCIFEDGDGHPWLSFGSYFSGIKIIRIDPSTGKQSGTDRNIYPVAEHPQSSNNSVEASAVYYHDGYYYLFVNWDACCVGSHSTYNIRIGRSKSVTGPYLDKDGKDMMQGGGSLFLGSLPDYGGGLPFDDEVGPGHAAILPDTDGDWFSCHYEWARDKNGATTVNVMKLTWGDDGWPSVDVPKYTPPLPSGLTYKISNQESGLRLYASGTNLLQETDDGTRAENWRIDGDSDMGYRITSSDNNLAVSTPNNAKAGDKIVLREKNGNAAQLWSVEPAGSGFYRFTNKASKLFLDDPGGSHDAGQQIGLWHGNDLPPQAWRLEVQADAQGIVPGATYKLVNAAGALCMDDPDGSRDPGTAIGLWTDNEQRPQRWLIAPSRDGSYTILCQASGLSLTGQTSGKVTQEAGNSSKAAQWTLQRTSTGAYHIVNVATGGTLGADTDKPASGAKLKLGKQSNSLAGQWFLVRE